MKKQAVSILMLLFIGTLYLCAQNRSEDEAREIAASFLASYNGGRVTSKSSAVSHNAKGTRPSCSPYYIVNDEEGRSFVIVAGDERMTTILGYSDKSGYDEKKVPKGLRGLLDSYAKAYECLQSENTVIKPIASSANVQVIDPLLQTTWGQGFPYNASFGGIYVTGCVATAMAQILNYHKYPLQATGRHSYVTKTMQVPMSFDSPVFDWDSMLDDYLQNPRSDKSIDAVSTLMSSCGISVDMDYGYDESGTSPDYVPLALTSYFDYKETAKLVPKSDYTDEAWMQMIDAELLADRPILYSSYNTTDNFGHSYVLDGKDADSRYHMNWGWDGSYNGYYALSALQPYSGLTINDDQNMVLGINPAKHRVTYMVEGRKYFVAYYADGETPPTVEAPVKDGYVFTGWENLPVVMGDKKLDVYAKYELMPMSDYSQSKDVLYIADADLLNCQNVTLCLNNHEDIIGFQCNVTLPAGVKLISVEKADRLSVDETAEVSFSAQKDGTYRILGFSQSNTPFARNSGALVNLSLSVDWDVFSQNDRGALITHQILSKPDFTSITASASRIDLLGGHTVYMRGDANNSGDVNVADITAVVSHIYGQTPENFNAEAADVNSNGEINVADITGIVSIIYGGSASGAKGATKAKVDEVTLSLPTVTANAGAEVCVPIYIDKADAISAYQFDLAMPENVHVKDFRSISDAHQCMGAYMENDKYRVMSYSLTNEKFVNGSAPVGYVTLMVDSDSQEGTYNVTLSSVAASANGKDCNTHVESGKLIVSNPTGINNIDNNAVGTCEITTLGGVKINSNAKLPKGVYIVNGKKQVVR